MQKEERGETKINSSEMWFYRPSRILRRRKKKDREKSK